LEGGKTFDTKQTFNWNIPTNSFGWIPADYHAGMTMKGRKGFLPTWCRRRWKVVEEPGNGA
jgi:hypothetical protein